MRCPMFGPRNSVSPEARVGRVLAKRVSWSHFSLGCRAALVFGFGGPSFPRGARLLAMQCCSPVTFQACSRLVVRGRRTLYRTPKFVGFFSALLYSVTVFVINPTLFPLVACFKSNRNLVYKTETGASCSYRYRYF